MKAMKILSGIIFAACMAFAGTQIIELFQSFSGAPSFKEASIIWQIATIAALCLLLLYFIAMTVSCYKAIERFYEKPKKVAN